MFFLMLLCCFFLGQIISVIIENRSVKISWKKVFCRLIRRLRDRSNLNWIEYADEALQACYFHCDLGSKILEMLDDPFTIESDWKNILPICKYADEWFERTHPYIKDIGRKEEWVKKLMA